MSRQSRTMFQNRGRGGNPNVGNGASSRNSSINSRGQNKRDASSNLNNENAKKFLPNAFHTFHDAILGDRTDKYAKEFSRFEDPKRMRDFVDIGIEAYDGTEFVKDKKKELSVVASIANAQIEAMKGFKTKDLKFSFQRDYMTIVVKRFGDIIQAMNHLLNGTDMYQGFDYRKDHMPFVREWPVIKAKEWASRVGISPSDVHLGMLFQGIKMAMIMKGEDISEERIFRGLNGQWTYTALKSCIDFINETVSPDDIKTFHLLIQTRLELTVGMKDWIFLINRSKLNLTTIAVPWVPWKALLII